MFFGRGCDEKFGKGTADRIRALGTGKSRLSGKRRPSPTFECSLVLRGKSRLTWGRCWSRTRSMNVVASGQFPDRPPRPRGCPKVSAPGCFPAMIFSSSPFRTLRSELCTAYSLAFPLPLPTPFEQPQPLATDRDRPTLQTPRADSEQLFT
jgi:hypothetical protein